MRAAHLLVPFLALWLCAGCRTTATRHISDPRPAVARLRAGGSVRAEADSLVEPLLAKGETYGAAVGVVTSDGATQTFGYGRTGWPGDSQPPRPDSLFQVGSVSKLFVEALLAQLVEEGQVRYEDTVRELLPPNIQVSPSVGSLTLYELATHTAGLPREPFGLKQFISLWRYFLTGRNIYAHLTTPYLYGYLRHAHVSAKQRGKYKYSNIGIGLLANLLEMKTGKPTTELIHDKLCRPLGLRDTTFFPDQEQLQRLTVGHKGNQACWKRANSPMAPWDMGEWMRPSAGLYSTVNDLLVFAKANLGLVSTPLASALARTHRVQFETAECGEALGWKVDRLDGGRVVLTYKDGMVSGYASYIGLNLQQRLAVVVLRNKFSWDERVGHNLLLRLSEASRQGPEITSKQ